MKLNVLLYIPVQGLASVADRHMHTGKPWQNLGGLAWYDNRARWYDPVTMRFTAPDPFAEKYPGITPWAFCRNNPVNYLDPTGKWIIGMDGEKVQFDNTLNVWSQNTSPDVIEIGNAMNTTLIGESQLNKMLSDENIGIRMEINREQLVSDANGKAVFGQTIRYYTATSEEDKRLTESKIIIYKKTINELGNNDERYSKIGATLLEMIGLVGVHESEHAINSNAMSELVGEANAEQKALETEDKAIKELQSNKQNR